MKLLTYFVTDQNAKYHVMLGFVGACISAMFFYLTLPHGMNIPDWCITLVGSWLVGIGIEVVQRIQRIGKQQNTLSESCLDAWVTFCGGIPVTLFLVVL